LQNVIFLPLQPKEKFNEFLNMADLHLVLQKADANDLVMPSKLSTILSVGGLALVTACKESSLHDIISRHEMGILVEPENRTALIDSIKKALQESFGFIQDNARGFASEYLTINKVIENFLCEVRITQKSLPTTTIMREEPIKADLLSA
jgi:colanic acid biosynthesis glycosyl transferase WcaI